MNRIKKSVFYFATLFILLLFSGCASHTQAEADYSYGLFSGTEDIIFQTDSQYPVREVPYHISMTVGDIKMSLLDSQGTTLGYHSLNFGFQQSGQGNFKLTADTAKTYTLHLEGTALNLQLSIGNQGIHIKNDLEDINDDYDEGSIEDLQDIDSISSNEEGKYDKISATNMIGKFNLSHGLKEVSFSVEDDSLDSIPYRYKVKNGSLNIALFDEDGNELSNNNHGFGMIMEGNGNFDIPYAGAYTLQLSGSASEVIFYLPEEIHLLSE